MIPPNAAEMNCATDVIVPATIIGIVELFVASALLVAPMFTVNGVGTVAGAVYRPIESIVPTVELPPATPFTDQFTCGE
jgi:hypothetical protein